MPMRKGKGKGTISRNIKEFHGGPTYNRTKRRYGKKRADKQAVAAALSQARRSGRKKPKPVRKVGGIRYSIV